ncbi:MAG: hypothetical protein ACR2MO_17880 [Acidimicrobiales bacterium]
MRRADAPPTVYRLGRRPDPWAWFDWSFADDARFGARYDDPHGIYRVLYASTERFTTFVECLACFRPDPAVIAGLAAIAGDPGDDEPPAAGLVPGDWIAARCVGTGTLVGQYVDVGHHETLAELRTALAARVVHHRLHDLDASAIRLTVPRSFTQEISRYVFDRSVGGERRWNGIAYRSRHGDDLANWAIFEPASPTPKAIADFTSEDPDLAAALRLHNLQLA